MGIRPREHFRSDSITSSGTYRSPTVVNVGVQKAPNFNNYRFYKDRASYLEKEKNLENEAVNLQRKDLHNKAINQLSRSGAIQAGGMVAGGILGGGVGAPLGVAVVTPLALKYSDAKKTGEAEDKLNKLEKQYKEYREKGE